ncbi:MAG: Gfo/Idh/MocA family oxidoreductase [Planctomycetota bacterium]
MSIDTPLRIAYIGCGGIARRHTQALLPEERVRITHLVDPSPDKMTAFKERFPDLADVPEVEDYREVLGEVDAVVIMSPHSFHHEQILAALDRGLHVLCEKPLACTVAHAKEIVAQVRETGLVLQIAYQRRTWPAIRYIHDQIRSGGLGTLQFISIVLTQAWFTLTTGTWRQDPTLSGGGELNDSGSHVMDSLIWFAGGLPRQVAAFLHNRGTPVDIDSAINARWDDGTLASVTIVGSAMPFSERWIVSGDRATVVYDRAALKRMDEAHGEWAEIELPPRDDGLVARNWLDAIEGKAELLSPAESAIGVTQITEAILRSAAAGGTPVSPEV